MIRRATIADAAVLAEIGRSSFVDAFAADPRNRQEDMAAYMDQAFAPATIAAELADPAIIYLLEQREGITAGYAKLNTQSAERCVVARKPIELARLYPRSQFIGAGVAAILMEACLDEARQRGHDVLWLGVWEFNPRAQRFYEKWGFRRVGEHTFLLGSDPQIDWIMQRAI
jgi:ribosomal protein S18 acetylase RimI-like enzyme